MEVYRFIHTADLHLDSALSSINNGQKAKARRVELTDSFKRMADFAKNNNVCGIIVAGDMFDVKNASPVVKQQVIDVIKSAGNVTFYLLGGNHDGKAFDDDFLSALPKNAVMLKNGVAYRSGNVVVAGFEGDVVDPAQVPVFEENTFNVAVMHGQVVSGNGEGINVKRLAGKNIDYLALGHIHKFEEGKIDRRGRWAYCGCPEGRGFDETGDKGFVLFDTLGNHKFVPFCKRQLHEIKVDITGLDSYISQLDKIKKQLAPYSKDDAFKVVLVGQVEPGTHVDLSSITAKLDDLFYAKVVDKTSAKFDVKKLESEQSLRGEFFRVVSSLDLPAEQKQQVLRFGFAAMDGRGIEDDQD
ncbi:MAG: metallophosphoesterase [Clostridia bacterium]|nr:metallophosphoesterase [Clostridia bacterium]